MNNVLELVKPSVREIAAYRLKERHGHVKLNQNESPYDLPPWLKEEIVAGFRSLALNRYPSFQCRSLLRKLSEYVKVPEERLVLGNGSNELLQMLISVVLSKGNRALLLAPTFAIYEQLARVAEAKIRKVDFEDDWSFPTERVLSAFRQDAFELCIFCSPNNPTGAVLGRPDLIRILQTTKGLVVVDEAYFEFSRETFLDLQDEYDNLILTRTFSKALGLAGLRIGYLIADPKMAREIVKAKLPYNLNVFSELVAVKLLEHLDVVEGHIQKILTEKARLLGELRAIEGVHVTRSRANFFMVETPRPGPELFARLVRQGVMVRDISQAHPRLKHKVRDSIGTPSENDALIKALKTCFS